MPRLNNPRQEAVAQLKADGYLDPTTAISNTQIIKKVYGYSQRSAEAHAPEIVRSRGVQNRLNELINERLSDEAISAKLKHLFHFKDKIIDKKTGVVIAKTENGPIQMEALKVMLRIKGIIKEGMGDIDARKVEYNMNFSQSPISSQLVGILERINVKIDEMPAQDGP